jgi:hypothetical protein
MLSTARCDASVAENATGLLELGRLVLGIIHSGGVLQVRRIRLLVRTICSAPWHV